MSRFYRQHTESSVRLRNVSSGEAGSRKGFGQAFVRLPRIPRKPERDFASRFDHSPHFTQSGHRVRPDCIELIARALSKVLSSNGNLSTEPRRRST